MQKKGIAKNRTWLLPGLAAWLALGCSLAWLAGLGWAGWVFGGQVCIKGPKGASRRPCPAERSGRNPSPPGGDQPSTLSVFKLR